MIAVAVFLFLILVVTLLGLAGRTTVPTTHDKMGLVYALILLGFSICLTCFWNACLVFNLIYIQGVTVVRIISCVLLLIPSLSIPTGYYILPRLHMMLLRRRGRQAIQKGNDPMLSTLINDLIEKMKIERPIEPIFLKLGNFSPHVFGSPCGKFFLAVPSNFEEMCSEAADKDREMSHSLMRLILAHELAHIKSGDHFWLPIHWIWRCSLIPCALFLLISRLSFVAGNDNNLMMLLSPMTKFMVIAAIIIGFLLRAAIKARESYADACSSLCISPYMLKILTDDTTSKISPLERFLFKTTNWIPVSRFLGYTARHLPLNIFDISEPLGFWNASKSLESFREEVGTREKHLSDKIYVFPSRDSSLFLNACIAGIVAALFYELGWLVKLSLFSEYLIENYAVPSEGWLKAMSEWGSSTSNALPVIIEAATCCMVGLAAGIVLLVPLRDSFAEIVNLNRRHLARFIIATIICLMVFTITSSIIHSRPTYPVFPTLRLRILPSQISLAAVIGYMLVTIIIRWSRIVSDICKLMKKLIPQLIIAIIPWFFIIILFKEVNLATRILLALSASMFLGFLANCGLGAIIARDDYIENEWFDYKRVLTLRRIRIGTPDYINRQETISDGLNLFAGMMSFAVPTFILALLAYPLLVNLDRWFVDNVGVLQEKFNELNEISMETVRGRGINIWRKYSWLYFMFTYAVPNGIPASTFTMLPILVAFNILCLVSVLIPATKDREAAARTIRRVTILTMISELLNIEITSADLKQRFKKALHKLLDKKKPYISSLEKLPHMRETSELLLHMENNSNNLLGSRKEIMLQWIKSCAWHGGGFGYAPGKPPDLLHTLSGISVLSKTDAIRESERQHHIAWLNKQYEQLLNDTFVKTSSEILQYGYLIVSSLSALDNERNLAKKQKDTFLTKIIYAWNSSSKKIQDGFNFISILNMLGNNEEIHRNLDSSWIEDHEQAMIRLDPKSQLETIWQMLKVLSILCPKDFRDRDSVKQVKDNLTKVYASEDHANVSFLEWIFQKSV